MSTLKKPSVSEIVIGKKQHKVTKIILGKIPYPKNKISMGAIAMVGTVCVATSRGYIVCFIILYLSIKTANVNDKTILIARPMIVSKIVTSECWVKVAKLLIKAFKIDMGDGNMNLGIISRADIIDQIIIKIRINVIIGILLFILVYISLSFSFCFYVIIKSAIVLARRVFNLLRLNTSPLF